MLFHFTVRIFCNRVFWNKRWSRDCRVSTSSEKWLILTGNESFFLYLFKIEYPRIHSHALQIATWDSTKQTDFETNPNYV